MKNHIKSILLQYLFFSIWLLAGVLFSLMLPPKVSPILQIGIFILSMAALFIFITFNYVITVKSIQFVENSNHSNFQKYVFSFLAYLGFYSIIGIFLIPIFESPNKKELSIIFTQEFQFYTLLFNSVFYVAAIISYKIFNKKSEL